MLQLNLSQQAIYRHAVVAALAVPARNAGCGGDLGRELFQVGLGRFRGNVRELGEGTGINGAPVGGGEEKPGCTVILFRPDREKLLVQLPVVEPSKLNKIVQRGLTPLRPIMLNLVGIYTVRLAAAGEAAGLVPQCQCPADRRRYGAGGSADVQDVAFPVLQYRHQAGVTGQATGGGCAQPLFMLELAVPGVGTITIQVIAQGVDIHMEQDLAAVAPLQAL